MFLCPHGYVQSQQGETVLPLWRSRKLRPPEKLETAKTVRRARGARGALGGPSTACPLPSVSALRTQPPSPPHPQSWCLVLFYKRAKRGLLWSFGTGGCSTPGPAQHPNSCPSVRVSPPGCAGHWPAVSASTCWGGLWLTSGPGASERSQTRSTGQNFPTALTSA